MHYQQFGVSSQWVAQVKDRMKHPRVREQVKRVVINVTKADLQDRAKVHQLLKKIVKIVGVPVSQQQAERIVDFVIAQKIDPQNTFQLLQLWSMFRSSF